MADRSGILISQRYVHLDPLGPNVSISQTHISLASAILCIDSFRYSTHQVQKTGSPYFGVSERFVAVEFPDHHTIICIRQDRDLRDLIDRET